MGLLSSFGKQVRTTNSNNKRKKKKHVTIVAATSLADDDNDNDNDNGDDYEKKKRKKTSTTTMINNGIKKVKDKKERKKKKKQKKTRHQQQEATAITIKNSHSNSNSNSNPSSTSSFYHKNNSISSGSGSSNFDFDFDSDISLDVDGKKKNKKKNNKLQRRSNSYNQIRVGGTGTVTVGNVGKENVNTTTTTTGTGTGTGTSASTTRTTLVTLHHLPDLILDLETAVLVGAKRPIRALQKLFLLSSSSSNKNKDTNSSSNNTHTMNKKNTTFDADDMRIRMVHDNRNSEGDHDEVDYGHGYYDYDTEERRLVPTLLKFLKRCTTHSKEHDLTLLVLNNISIPPKNKKTVALDYNAIEILSKLLCEDPSCYLIVIVLVTLTRDYDCRIPLRKQIVVTHNDKTALIESLAFALRVSSLTQSEYDERQITIDDMDYCCNYGISATGNDAVYASSSPSPSARLSILMAKDQQLRSSASATKTKTLSRSPTSELRSTLLLRSRSRSHSRSRQPASTDTTGIKDILLQLQSDEEELQQQLDKLAACTTNVPTVTATSATTHDFPCPRSALAPDDPTPTTRKYIYPETTKWCLSALQNLSQPDSDGDNDNNNESDDNPTSSSSSIVANILIKSGIYSLILQQFVTTSRDVGNGMILQDIALSIIFNLSACTKSREYMNEPETIKVLSMVTAPPPPPPPPPTPTTNKCVDDTKTSNFQSLKAKMALSHLIGSQGHYGQPKLRSIASTVQANQLDSSLVLTETEIYLLLKLLVNTLYHRGGGSDDEDDGVYLVGTFSLRCVLFSLRCLLTHTTNQEMIATFIGLDLNAILINILARYGRPPSIIDSESAEHLVFCLYLQSNYGFGSAGFGGSGGDDYFLPDMYAPPPLRRDDDNDVDHGLAANILVTYLLRSDRKIRPAGCHAAEQLLLRLKYMNFHYHTHNTSTCTSLRRRRNGKTYRRVIRPEDLKINYILLAKLKRVRIPDRKHGSKPNPMIFCRPVLRCQIPLSTSSSGGGGGRMPLWNNYNPAAVSTFASALLAVQQLSYGSIKVRHNRGGNYAPIDDISIANNIVYCSNNQKEEIYNFSWAWKDFKVQQQQQHDSHDDDDDDKNVHEWNKKKSNNKINVERLFGCGEEIDSPIPFSRTAEQKKPQALGPISFLGSLFCASMDNSFHDNDDDDGDYTILSTG